MGGQKVHLFNTKSPDIDAVFFRYGDMLYRVALARVGNDADAQDIVQDVFVKYITARSVFKDQDHEKAWFLRTTINHCNDFARRQKLRIFLPIDEAHHIAAETQNGLSEVLSLVAELPTIYKDVVILHSLEGFSVEETAKMLDISLSAAKMRLSRAREMLQILRKEKNDVY